MKVTMRMRRRAVRVVKDTDSGEGKQVPFVNIISKPTEEVPHSAVASLVFQQHISAALEIQQISLVCV